MKSFIMFSAGVAIGFFAGSIYKQYKIEKDWEEEDEEYEKRKEKKAKKAKKEDTEPVEEVYEQVNPEKTYEEVKEYDDDYGPTPPDEWFAGEDSAVKGDVEEINEVKKHKGKEPKIISRKDANNMENNEEVENETLFWYKDDDMLYDEDDRQVDEFQTVGRALTKYGFKDNDEKIIYVMNWELNTCYTVQKIFGKRDERRE